MLLNKIRIACYCYTDVKALNVYRNNCQRLAYSDHQTRFFRRGKIVIGRLYILRGGSFWPRFDIGKCTVCIRGVGQIGGRQSHYLPLTRIHTVYQPDARRSLLFPP